HLLGVEKTLRLRLAEEIVGVEDDDALWTYPSFLEDLRHEADGVAPEGRRAGKDTIHVLDFLLSFTHGLGDIGGGVVGRADVRDGGNAALLRERREGRHMGGMKAAGEELGAASDEPLRLRAGSVHLGLAVRHEQLETRAPQRLDTARGVDGLDGELGAE